MEDIFDTLESINSDELNQIIYIRNEGHTIHEAVERHLAHVSSHIGQIIFTAKFFKGKKWQTLTIPKGKTEEHNQRKVQQPRTIGFYKDRIK